MKKENKKLAQQRRAQERAQAQAAAAWKKIVPFLIAAAVIAVIAGAAIAAVRKEQRAAQPETSETASAAAEQKKSGDLKQAGTEAEGGYVQFDAASMKDAYDISKDKLTYVQISVKDYGTITAALDETIAPVSVQNFISLAKDGFYDGLTFHRIIDGFMIQGGDPQGNGTGGSDKNIKGEFDQNGVKNPITHVRGAVSMARAQDPDSASSQFFIVQSDSTFLDGQYAGFGYVTDGMEIVDQICKDAKPTDGNGSIAKDSQPVIESVTVLD